MVQYWDELAFLSPKSYKQDKAHVIRCATLGCVGTRVSRIFFGLQIDLYSSWPYKAFIAHVIHGITLG